MSFVKTALKNKEIRQIGKELFELIVDVVKNFLDDELNIKYIITRLIKLILASLI